MCVQFEICTSHKVCLQNMVDYFITLEYYNQWMNDVEDEAESIIKMLKNFLCKTYNHSNSRISFIQEELIRYVIANKEWLIASLSMSNFATSKFILENHSSCKFNVVFTTKEA